MAAREVTARSLGSLGSAMHNLSVDAPQNRCYLLKIPGEMRNKIYEYALIFSDEGVFNIDLDAAVQVRSKDALMTLKAEYRRISALPVTCKKIQKETQKLMYSLNSLRICASVDRFYKPPPVLSIRAYYDSLMPVLERVSQQPWVNKPWREVIVLSLGRLSRDHYDDVSHVWYTAAFFMREVRRLLPPVEVEVEIAVYGQSLGMYRFGLSSPEALKADFRKRARMADGMEGPLTEAQLSLAEGTIHTLVGVFERESSRNGTWHMPRA